MPIKIAVIGAGSSTFSLSLVRDLCLTPNLRGSQVCLMDIDTARLDGVHGLCARLQKEVGAELALQKTTDRREALEGADFVIHTALAAGGHKRLLDGWEIGAGLGYRFGGSYHVMHDEAFWINFCQLQLMESILRDVMEICPDAWMLLVANPVLAGTTYLLRKYPRAKLVGLCHGTGMVHGLADALGLDRSKITYEIPGVNHFVWLTRFFYEGRDAFPLIDRWIEEKAPEYWKTCPKSDYLGPKPVDLYKRFGAFPIGDTANPGGGAWPHWYHTDDETELRWLEDPLGWYKIMFRDIEGRADEINALAADPSRKVTDVFPARVSGEPMIPLIEAIACDIPRVIIVNIRNEGRLVPGVPEDFEAEAPALISARGVEGIRTQGLPRELVAYILRDRVAPVELELKAFETRSRDLLVRLIMTDPFTRSERQANELMNRILALPYNEEMREYYR